MFVQYSEKNEKKQTTHKENGEKGTDDDSQPRSESIVELESISLQNTCPPTTITTAL
jgi:hypothetical protein